MHPSKEKFVKMLEKNIARIPGLCCQSVRPYRMTLEIDVTDGNKAKSTSATTQEHSAKFSSRLTFSPLFRNIIKYSIFGMCAVDKKNGHTFILCRKTSLLSHRRMSPRISVGHAPVPSAGLSTGYTSSDSCSPHPEQNNNIKTQADVTADNIIHPPDIKKTSKSRYLETVDIYNENNYLM